MCNSDARLVYQQIMRESQPKHKAVSSYLWAVAMVALPSLMFVVGFLNAL